MTRLFLVTMLFGLGIPSWLAGAPYCAFEVKVMKPSGAPNPNIPVLMVQEGRQTFETKSDANGIARICDAPLGYVDIAAGLDVCGLVTVKDVTPEWLTTVRVFITFEDIPVITSVGHKIVTFFGVYRTKAAAPSWERICKASRLLPARRPTSATTPEGYFGSSSEMVRWKACLRKTAISRLNWRSSVS
jgi:hypothetical protein